MIPKIRKVQVRSLKPSKHNPVTRTNPKGLKKLVASIKQFGLQYPLLVDRARRVIDGHRRFAAIKLLGWKTVYVIVSAANPDDVYATVNDTARRHTGNESLTVWLARPAAVPPQSRPWFAQMVKVLGVARVRRIAKQGYGMRLFKTAVAVGIYIDRESNAGIAKVVDWLLARKQARIAEQIVRYGRPGAWLKRAIDQKADLPAAALGRTR